MFFRNLSDGMCIVSLHVGDVQKIFTAWLYRYPEYLE